MKKGRQLNCNSTVIFLAMAGCTPLPQHIHMVFSVQFVDIREQAEIYLRGS